MEFILNITYHQSLYKLQVQHLVSNKSIEQYKVISGSHSIVLQNNRPLFRNKGLKHRKPTWKVVEGDYKNEALLKIIIAELVKRI